MEILCWLYEIFILGPVLLEQPDNILIFSTNGSAAFIESCTPIG